MSEPLTGIERTLQTLLRSTNPAATDLLVTATESSIEPLRVGAVRALAMRDDTAGHEALMERFHQLDRNTQEALADVDPRAPLLATLISQIRPDTPRRAKRAAEIARLWGASAALPAIVAAAQWTHVDTGEYFAEVALRLAELIAEAVRAEEQRAPGEARGYQEDPAFLRRAAIDALGRALGRYGDHQQSNLIEAMLLITPPDEPSLVGVLRHPAHPAYDPLIEALTVSHGQGAIALLASALRDPASPRELLLIASGRYDTESLRGIYRRLGNPIGARAKQSAERIDALGWIAPEQVAKVLELSDQEQAAAIQYAASTKASRRQLADAICLLIDEGQAAGRRAAAHAIDRLPGHVAIEPLAMAIESHDPLVVSVAVKLLRKKDYPQATNQLLLMLDSDDETVRKAAQRALHEVSFSAFRENIDTLTHEEQRRAGGLVAKADPSTRPTIASELKAAASSRRLRALEMIELMGLSEAMRENLVEALTDRDVGVRCEAIRLLGNVDDSPELRAALTAALVDHAPPVRNAAQTSLLQLDALAAAGAAPAVPHQGDA